MSQVDWSKAPEWARRHGITPGGLPCWIDDGGYSYEDKRQDGRYFKFREGWDESEFGGVVGRPYADWNGDGLPPVGTVCEVEFCEEWCVCEIIAHFEQPCGMVAAFTVSHPNGAKSLDAYRAGEFRPIRTPEQIAKEEREKEISAMVALSPLLDKGWSRKVCVALYDAGYRKLPSPPEE